MAQRVTSLLPVQSQCNLVIWPWRVRLLHYDSLLQGPADFVFYVKFSPPWRKAHPFVLTPSACIGWETGVSHKKKIFLLFSVPLQLPTVRVTSGSDSSNYCQSQTSEFLVPERCFHPNIQLSLVGPSPQSAHQPHQADSSAGTALQ